MKTLREKFIQALTQLGETKVKETYKYVVYSRKEGGNYYIGRSDSLRFGATVVSSIPVSQRHKAALLEDVS